MISHRNMCIICSEDYDINMTTLDCSKCENIDTLPILPNLVKLICISSSIREIPRELVKLEILDCRCCTELVSIPETLVNLKVLNCFYTNIEEIPKELIHLQKLNISFCREIETLSSELTNLQVLHCDYSNLRFIPKELIKLTSIKFSGTMITLIPKELTRLRILHAHPTIKTLEFHANPRLCYYTGDEEDNCVLCRYSERPFRFWKAQKIAKKFVQRKKSSIESANLVY